VGERDDDWWELGQAAARALPVAETVRLSGLHHLAAFWRSDLTAPPIRGFLDTVGWPKGSLRHSR
jgi:hypothetical protein